MIDINPESLIAGLSALAAWFAVLFAYRSIKISQRALDLAESINKGNQTNISAYLADSFRVIDHNSNEERYVFSIAYSNKSESADSVTEVNLETFYLNSANRISHLISAHEPAAKQWLLGKAVPAQLPINIQARSAVTSWFVFGIPAIAKDAKQIKKYRVIAKNSVGEEAAIESYILREVKL